MLNRTYIAQAVGFCLPLNLALALAQADARVVLNGFPV